MWSDNHSGAFEDAIRESIPDNWEDSELRKSRKAFKGILHAVEGAYAVSVYGVEVLPKPKASILHRGLRKIAEAAGLGEQTNVGIAEFFDDLCPCGIRNHKQALQKLSDRSGRNRHRSSKK
jgi:hypothetical protein